jgi:branched-chain amino acid transport system substrate-binding protein
VKSKFVRTSSLVVLACSVSLVATACSASGKSSTGSTSAGSTSAGPVSSAPVSSPAAAGSSAAGPASSSSTSSAAKIDAPDGPIKIGAIYSLSGSFAAFGPSQQATGQAAIDQVNADGGIGGHQLVLDVKDDKSTPDGAVAAAQALVSDKVAMFAYFGTSPQTLQAGPVVNKAKIPAITLLTDATFEDGGKWPYIFNNYSDAKQGVYPYAPFLKSKGVTKVVSINDTTPGSATFSGYANAAVKAAGIQVLKSVSFDPTAVDLTTQVQQLKASGTNWLLANNVVGFGPLYNALRAVGWHPNILETTAAYYDSSGALKDFAPTTWAGCNVGATPGKELPAGITKVLAAATTKLGHAQPDLLVSVASAYDSLLIFKYAVEKAGTTKGEDVIKVLDTINNQSFSNPDWTFSFTSSNHLGWVASNNHICAVTPLDKYGTPTIVDAK